jgi:hypothetical protein
MRAVVKVKPVGGKGASRVARYIAESKLDPVREGPRRPLFSDKYDDLNDRTYRQANQYLSLNNQDIVPIKAIRTSFRC